MRLTSSVPRAVATALVTAYFIACSTTPGRGSEHGGACTLHSDCESGSVCLFRICSPPCREDVDCAAGSRCLNTLGGTACVSQSQAQCTPDGCPRGTTCSEGTCRSSCSGTSECLADQTCAAKVCVGANPTHDTPGDGNGGASGTGGVGGVGGVTATRDAGMGTGARGSGGNGGITDAGSGGTDGGGVSGSGGADSGDAGGDPCLGVLFRNYGTSTVDAAAQLVSKGNVLSVSLQVFTDPDQCTVDDFHNSWDRIFVGFRNPSTNAVALVEVALTGTDQAMATGHYEKNWTRANGTSTLGGGVGLPAWASDVHVSVNQTVGAATIPWAITLKIDLAQAQSDLGTANLGATDFWYAVNIGTGHATSPVPSVDVVLYEWPSGAGSDLGLIEASGVQTAPTLPTTWGKLVLGTRGPGCAGL